MASVSVRGSTMHYVEVGCGETVVFIHGNPTSSYLWRNVIGPVSAAGYRCIAVDLIGMGRSGPSRDGYGLADHIEYVETFLDVLDLGSVTLVGHDWGAVIALDLARRLVDRIRGVALMEGHIHPIDSWRDMDDGQRELFSTLRTSVGERMVLEDNVFVETVLPSGVLRELTAAEMYAYRRPFVDPQSRLPILQWVRQIPIEGQPTDVASIVIDNQRVLTDPDMPTLVLHGTPGAVIGAQEIEWCREKGRAMTIIEVGAGTHFLPEDLPVPIGNALVRWLNSSTGGTSGSTPG